MCPADLARPNPAVPPPSRLALLASWWGAAEGRPGEHPVAGSRAPASECTAVSSRDSSRVEVGEDAGDPLGELVLPDPFGPESSRWCPRRRRPRGRSCASAMPWSVAQVDRRRIRCSPRQRQQPAARTSARPAAPRGRARPAELGDHLGEGPHPDHVDARDHASPPRPVARARTTRRKPASAAASTIGSTPGTDRSPPARVSSPMNTVARQRVCAGRHRWRPAPRPRWRGRSGSRAWAGRQARGGWWSAACAASRNRLLMIANRQRSRASLSAVSGRPTSTVVVTCPDETSAWTSTRWPTSAVWEHRAGGRERHVRPPPRRGRRSRRRVEARAGRPRRRARARAGRRGPPPTPRPAGAAAPR